MHDEFFNKIAKIMSKHKLVRQIDELGRAYYLEFQTKSILIDGENRRYVLRGCSKNKKDVYETMIEIHNEFNLDTSFLDKANFEDLEEYVFHLKKLEIDGKFASYRRV